MLVKNAQNLMRAVIRTVHAAEAACMKVHTAHMCATIPSFNINNIGSECS